MNTKIRLQSIRQFVIALIVIATLFLSLTSAPLLIESISTPDTDSLMKLADHGQNGGG